MDDFLYFIIIIGLTIFIIFYGGHNNQNQIEYNSDYFNSLNSIINFEKKINFIHLNNADIFKNTNFININKYLNTTSILIPNFVNCFLIKINPNSFFNIFNLINKSIAKSHMMIIFNHHKHNNLELLVDDKYELVYYDSNIITDQYFYELKNNISITTIYNIYNDSNKYVVITCFILKKPFWHK